MTKNPYGYIEAKIIDIVDETHNIKTLSLRPAKPIGFRAGQFMGLTVPGIGEAPFTPSSNHNVSDRLEFTIMKAGRVTKALHEMRPGDVVGLRGPYGIGYPLDEFKSKDVFIVGGGVGLAPLRALLYAIFNEVSDYRRIIIKYGSRTSNDIVYRSEIESWRAKAAHVDIELTVDVGDQAWNGNVGIVTTLLKDFNVEPHGAVSVVCGPPVMMKFVTFKLMDLGFADRNIYLSMEKNMSCGIGKCGHCRIGPYYACKDGPVFTYDRIKDLPNIWD